MSAPGTLFLLARRSLRTHLLSTGVTALAVALACGLTMSVFNIRSQAHDAFAGHPLGFDAVLGARGSQEQLVLNCVYHLETSPGNIRYAIYKEMQKSPLVSLAVPYAVGDNYHGFRIVGTTTDMFTKFEYRPGKKMELEPGGILFDPHRMEAVIGSYVAEKTGLKVNSTFHPYHGFVFDPNEQHSEVYHVVGVLKPTNTPNDQAIWIPLEGMYRMKGHVLRGTGQDYIPKPGEAIPDEDKEVSAVMLKFKSPDEGFAMNDLINRQGKVLTLAYPVTKVMDDFLRKIGWVDTVLEMVAYLVVAVSAMTILASLYNTMNERRREFAILRALGARRRTIFAVVVAESAGIAALGAVLSFPIYALIVYLAAAAIRSQTGVVLDVFAFGSTQIGAWNLPVVVAAPLAMVAIGALSGLLPAWKAYRTDVAADLTPLT